MPNERMKAEDREREVARKLVKPHCTECDDHDYPQEDCRKCANLAEEITEAMTAYASQQVLAARLEEAKWWWSNTNEQPDEDKQFIAQADRIAALEQQQAKVANGLTGLGVETEEG